MRLEKDFGFDDDTTMETLQRSSEELRKAKLDYAGPPLPHELPKKPFGVFVEPTIDLKIGRRKSEFTHEEKLTKDTVIMRRDTAIETALMDSDETMGNHRHSRLSIGDSIGLGGKLTDQSDYNCILVTHL